MRNMVYSTSVAVLVNDAMYITVMLICVCVCTCAHMWLIFDLQLQQDLLGNEERDGELEGRLEEAISQCAYDWLLSCAGGHGV